MCSGTLGADSTGGPGETCPVLEHLSAGSWREGPKLWPLRYIISTQSHTGLLWFTRSTAFLFLRPLPVMRYRLQQHWRTHRPSQCTLFGTSCASCSGGRKDSLHLISSSDQQGSNLLKVEFIKVSSQWTVRQGESGFVSTAEILSQYNTLDYI